MWRMGLHSTFKSAMQDIIAPALLERELRVAIDIRERLAALEARRG